VSVGFEFAEKLSGTYHTLADPGKELPISITITARVHDVTRFAIDPTARIEGEIDAEGFADHRALEGTLEIHEARACMRRLAKGPVEQRPVRERDHPRHRLAKRPVERAGFGFGEHLGTLF